MSEISIPNYILIVSALAISWVIVDFLSNLFLMKKQKGCKLRFIGARWLKRKHAIEVAFLQFAVAFGFSFLLEDFFSNLFLQAFEYLVPIVFATIGILYLYILGTLPYKIKKKHCLPSILLFTIAGFLFYTISQVIQ